jgi:CRP-like cAMP-binding protein|tara:strand:- start:330 stop:1052 length:723 start_codon:yes stop_codon:yes gene_type:complete
VQDQDLEFFYKHPLFRQFDPDILMRILAGIGPVEIAKGETIFHRGDPADTFYFVLDGWIKVYRMTLDGEEALFRMFSAGETIADAVAFFGDDYPASAQAVERSRVVPILSRRILNELKKSPELSLSIIGSLSRHMHELMVEIERLKTRTATQRVCDYLLQNCTVAEGSAVISVPFDRTVLSSRLGMKPQSLSRIFNRLRNIGVKSEADRVAIADVAALIQFSKSDASEVGNGSSPMTVHK